MDTFPVATTLAAPLAAARGTPVLLCSMALALLLSLTLGTVLTIWIAELRHHHFGRLPSAQTNSSSMHVHFWGLPRSGFCLADVVLVGPEREERHYRLLPFAMLNLLALVFFGAANSWAPLAGAPGRPADAGLCLALALLAFITARGTVLLGSGDMPSGGTAARRAAVQPGRSSGLSLVGVIGFAAALALVAESVAALSLRDALGLLLRAAIVMPLVAGLVVTALAARLFVHAHAQYAEDPRAQRLLRRRTHLLALPFLVVETVVWVLGAVWLAGGGVGAEHVAWLGAGSWLGLGAAYVLSTWAHRANNYLAATLGAPGVPIIDNTPAERLRMRQRILCIEGSGLAETARRQPLLLCIVGGHVVIGVVQLIVAFCTGGTLGSH